MDKIINIDELSKEIRLTSNEKVVNELADLLISWKDNQETAEELKEIVEKYLGNIWLKNEEDHTKIYQLWASFRKNVIESINGMTMNERLYWFGLFKHFDTCPDESSKLNIYRKLHAAP